MKNKTSSTILNAKVFHSFVTVTIIIALFGSIGDIIDSIFLLAFYDTSNNVMAAKSINDVLLIFLRIIPVTLSVGAQKKYGAEIAKGNIKKAQQVFSVTLITTFFYSLIFVFINYFLGKSIASFISIESPELIEISTMMIKGLSFGLPFMFINSTISCMLIIDGGKRTALLTLASTIFVNVIGDVLVVFVFKGSIFDIMLVTSIAHFITTLVTLSRLLSKKSQLKFSFHFKDLKLLGNLFSRGSSGGVNYLTTAIVSIYINIMLLYIAGSEALNVWGVQQQFLIIVTRFVEGYFTYAFLIQNIYAAEEDLKGMEQLFKSTLKTILFIIIPLCILFASFAGLYIGLNTDFDSNYKQWVIVFTIACASLIPFDALMYIAAVFCDLKKCILIYIISILSCPIIFSLAFSRLQDVTLLVVGYAFGRSIYPFIHLLVALIKYKKIPTDVKHLFFFPNDFGYSKNDSIDIQIKSIIDCMKIADIMREFCVEHRIDPSHTNIISSCAEEMANIYIMSGFTKDLKKHYCSLRVCIKNGQVIFRMRDDCPFFLSQKIQQMAETDPICNISYKILISRAKKIKYASFFNLNNYIISL